MCGSLFYLTRERGIDRMVDKEAYGGKSDESILMRRRSRGTDRRGK